MKAISLIQPWASLVVTGAKTWETRSWATKYRGPILIHASGRKIIRKLCHELACWEVQGGLAPLKGLPLDVAGCKTWAGVDIDDLPFGAIIGEAILTDCKRTNDLTLEEIQTEKFFGDFNLGRYAWKLEQPKRFVPCPYKGQLGIFEVGAYGNTPLPERGNDGTERHGV